MKSYLIPCVLALCLGTAMTMMSDNNPGTPWPATDALVRRLPTPLETGPVQTNRFVGIFYFEWLGPETPIHKSPNWESPYDIAKIFSRDPEAMKKPESPLWGKIGEYHYWSEPLFGYYQSADPWVIRRHAQLLTDAGVDTLIFDATNAETYRKVYMAICAMFQKIRQSGGRTPQLAFMLNTAAGATAQTLYNDFYKTGLYSNLWFRWQGKPLLLCDRNSVAEELKGFFTFRTAHWPFTLTNTPYAWHWEATYPQPYGYTDDPNRPEQVVVSVAQNLRVQDGKVTNMSSGEARGRSFHNGRQDTNAGAVHYGFNVQEQWKRAFELKPPFVLVTGWNEWIAGRWGEPKGPLVFVDQFDQEFSRDIEPMKGGHSDNYYYQMVASIRRYKGAPALAPASAPKRIRIEAGFEQWHDVLPEFKDHIGEIEPRDFAGVAGLHYTNFSGRNDIVTSKVARDDRNIFFYVRTREPLTPNAGTNWMWLLIDADQNAATGWEGYDFILNRTMNSAKDTWLEKNKGEWTWEKVSKVSFHISGSEMQLAIPREKLGLQNGSSKVAIDFKWADNAQHPGDIMDFYVSGDVAPEGRFNYRYEGK
jgi:hypothetical protein